MSRLFQKGMLTALLLAMFSAPAVWAQDEAVGEPAAETETVEAATPEEVGATGEEQESLASPEDAVEEEVSAADYWGAYEKDEIAWTLNNLWIMICGCLVFIMHLGFASLECGLTRQKNTINILFKNTMIISIGLLTYALVGFNVMYPGFADGEGFLKLSAIPNFITTNDVANLSPDYNAGYTWYTDFFFQAMFAATCATIVSGAVAGRIKLSSFLVFSTLLLVFCYPVTGAWKWGAGWLDQAGFYDFAGSTLVHSVGGWAALVMALILGPRLGKYNADGTSNAIPGSNMPLVAVGVFLLWFGWFGFNGGSVLSANAVSVSLVLVTTSMAAAAGGLAAGLTSWVMDKKPDVSMALNGILAGLVGITAGADLMSVAEAVIIGAVSGVLVYFSVVTVDKKVDDPVGAVSVHLVCGVWGTLAVGIFGDSAGFEQFLTQLKGVLAVGVYVVVFTAVAGLAIKQTMGLRVDPEEEEVGLDVSEHGMKAYN